MTAFRAAAANPIEKETDGMYVILIFILSCLLGWVIWRGLRRTKLPPIVCALLAMLCIVLIFIALFWISVYVSVLLLQLKDPVS